MNITDQQLTHCQRAMAQVAAVQYVLDAAEDGHFPSLGDKYTQGYLQAASDVALAMRVSVLEHKVILESK